MAVPPIQTRLGVITLPATPTPASSVTELLQSVSVWTRKAQLAMRQLETTVVNLDTSVIPETPSGLYFTDALARAAISSTAPITYDSTTGVIGLSTPLAVQYGGTGLSSVPATLIPYGDGTNPLATDSRLSWDSTLGNFSATHVLTDLLVLATSPLVILGTAPSGNVGGITVSSPLSFSSNTLALTGVVPFTKGGTGLSDFGVPTNAVNLVGVQDGSNVESMLRVQADSPLTMGSALGVMRLRVQNAAADGSTKGASTFTAADFNDDGSGLISIDYTNGQKATTSLPGFLSSTDWNTFNNKQDALPSFASTRVLFGAGTSTPSTSANFTYNGTDLSIATGAFKSGSTGIFGSLQLYDAVAGSYLVLNGADGEFEFENDVSVSGNLDASGGLIIGTLSSTMLYANNLGQILSLSVSSPLSFSGSTLSIANAAADGSTKGAAAFTASDFDSASGVISLDYTNGQKATTSVPGFLSAADWTTFNSKPGYVLALGLTTTSSPASSTTYYMSGISFNQSLTGATTYANGKVEIPKSGTIKRIFLKVRTITTLGSSETVTHAIRINDTTDVGTLNMAYGAAEQHITDSSISQSVTAGDFVALKVVTPSWGTRPQYLCWEALLYIE